MDKFIVHKSINIKATPAKVWDALTDPKKTKKYFFNCEVYSDWKTGSSITFKGKMFFFIKIEMAGKILEVIPGKILKYNLANNSDNSSTISTVTDELSYVNGETIVSVTDDVGNGGNAQKRYNRSEKGWTKVLTGLKKLVEQDID